MKNSLKDADLPNEYFRINVAILAKVLGNIRMNLKREEWKELMIHLDLF
jgi:hypothetical protein